MNTLKRFCIFLGVFLFCLSNFAATTIKTVTLPGNYLLYNPHSDMIFVTVPDSALAPYGNHLVSLDPHTGQLKDPVFAGSEPCRMVITDDGSRIFAALNGNNRIITFDPAAGAVDGFFEIGEVDDRVEDMETVPGHSSAVVVSKNPGPGGSRNRGLVVFVDGSPLPEKLGGPINAITFSDSPAVLYGHNSGISPHNNLMTIKVDLNPEGGLQLDFGTPDVFSAYQDEIQFAGGHVYGQRGEVIIAETHKPAGKFNVPFGNPPFVADSALGLTFFVYKNTVKIFNQTTFLLEAEIKVPDLEDARQIIRWGANGLAVRNKEQIFLIETDLFGMSVDAAFERGDANADNALNLADVTCILGYLFGSSDNMCKEKVPECLDAADVNDDGSVNLADAVSMLHYLFAGGEPLTEPFLKCGTDPSPDQLGCKVFVCSD